MRKGSNQSPVFADIDFWSSNAALRDAAGDDAEAGKLASCGRESGKADMMALGRAANDWPPRLHRTDEKGDRLELVEYHPAYHALMRRGVAAGLHNGTHAGQTHVSRGARFYMTAAVECGHLCPLTMTHAGLAVLAAAPEPAPAWRPALLSREYDPTCGAPLTKSGLTLGMGMTERQGGSDLRSNTTSAQPTGADGAYVLNGHKWFLSAPMSDGFLVLAKASRGLTAFSGSTHPA